MEPLHIKLISVPQSPFITFVDPAHVLSRNMQEKFRVNQPRSDDSADLVLTGKSAKLSQ